MRLTVLGNTGRYLAPLSGGSGYLVEHEGTRVLLDCGSGVRASLARLALDRVDAVVLSHFHHDHVADFVTVSALVPDGTPVIVPPGEAGRIEALADGFGFRGAWDIPGLRDAPLDEGPLDVGAVRLRFARTRHSVPSIGTRIESRASGRSITYASDSAPCDELRDLAHETDLLLMHALLPVVDPASEHAKRHSTASTASALATRAHAKRLVLSHRYHESRDTDMLAEARLFPRVELARDDAVIDV